MEREELFEKFGFECVGGVIEGGFDILTNDYNVDAKIYVDFKKKRVMIDGGEFSDPIFLKGDLTQRETNRLDVYEKQVTKEIDNMSGLTEAIRRKEKGEI